MSVVVAAGDIVLAVGVNALFVRGVSDVVVGDARAVVALQIHVDVVGLADVVFLAGPECSAVWVVSIGTAAGVHSVFPGAEEVARALLLPVAILALQLRVLAHTPLAAVEIDVTVSVPIVRARFPVLRPSTEPLLVHYPVETLPRALPDFLSGQTLAEEARVAVDGLVLEIVHVAEIPRR